MSLLLNNETNSSSTQRGKTYAFFHPYCNAGGGGERVLWQAVKDTLTYEDKNKVIIYTGDIDTTSDDILANVVKRFDIELDKGRINWVFLKKRNWVDSKKWPKFTLLGQAIGSLILCHEALSHTKFKPDVWIDTMGYPFMYPLVWFILGVPIIAYVHFPIISKDMLNKLNVSFDNLSGLKDLAKFIYWYIFLLTYTFVGYFVDITLTNSTWTNNHIQSIWWLNNDIEILYPPCSTEKFIDITELSSLSKTWNRENKIIVLAQFRPEKRHSLIITQYAEFLTKISTTTNSKAAPKLTLIGSIRNSKDREYVVQLENLAKSLSIPSSKIEFLLDLPYEQVLKNLQTATYGLNAMWNEHFGIAVVEYVANGLIPIVHASAGPFLDIVIPWNLDTQKKCDDDLNEQNRTGFYFKDSSDYDYDPNEKFLKLNEVLIQCMELNDEKKWEITRRGKDSVLERFSDLKFDNEWNETLYKVNLIGEHGSSDVINWIGWIIVIVVGISLARYI